MRLTLAGPTLKRCSNLFQTNLWQGSRLIAETDNDKHWQTYLYEPDSYRPLALVHGNAQQDNIKLYWYQNDHLGTPIALTSNMGDTLYECQYNAYGQIINETYHQDDFNALPDNPLRFQGQYYDEETGLHYNLNRYYDPFTGRYITQDPLGILGGLNSYQYTGSDPINWVDPLGLIKIENSGFEGIAGKEYKISNGADTAIPKTDLDHPIVQSRINIQNGNNKEGWYHVLKRHFGGKSNASQFIITEEETKSLIGSKQVIDIPISNIRNSTFEGTERKLYERVVNFNKNIGIDKFTGKPTNTITILTDKAGNLITATPGRLPPL
jgi:RHS repeat-associated protein